MLFYKSERSASPKALQMDVFLDATPLGWVSDHDPVAELQYPLPAFFHQPDVDLFSHAEIDRMERHAKYLPHGMCPQAVIAARELVRSFGHGWDLHVRTATCGYGPTLGHFWSDGMRFADRGPFRLIGWVADTVEGRLGQVLAAPLAAQEIATGLSMIDAAEILLFDLGPRIGWESAYGGTRDLEPVEDETCLEDAQEVFCARLVSLRRQLLRLRDEPPLRVKIRWHHRLTFDSTEIAAAAEKAVDYCAARDEQNELDEQLMRRLGIPARPRFQFEYRPDFSERPSWIPLELVPLDIWRR